MVPCDVCGRAAVDQLMHPCGHAVCTACARTWFAEAKRASCPVCKRDVMKLPGFAYARGDDSQVHLSWTSPVGMHTLVQTGLEFVDYKMQAVRVNILAPSMLHGGLRNRDIITHMNGIPMHTSTMAESITNLAHATGASVVCTLESHTIPRIRRILRRGRSNSI